VLALVVIVEQAAPVFVVKELQPQLLSRPHKGQLAVGGVWGLLLPRYYKDPPTAPILGSY
jgi:hypothetical protein